MDVGFIEALHREKLISLLVDGLNGGFQSLMTQ
jgi:hypothetical protein